MERCKFVNTLMFGCYSYTNKGKLLFLTGPFNSNMDTVLSYPQASKIKLTGNSEGQVIRDLGMYCN